MDINKVYTGGPCNASDTVYSGSTSDNKHISFEAAPTCRVRSRNQVDIRFLVPGLDGVTDYERDNDNDNDNDLSKLYSRHLGSSLSSQVTY